MIGARQENMVLHAFIKMRTLSDDLTSTISSTTTHERSLRDPTRYGDFIFFRRGEASQPTGEVYPGILTMSALKQFGELYPLLSMGDGASFRRFASS